jgi:hypothetical protein
MTSLIDCATVCSIWRRASITLFEKTSLLLRCIHIAGDQLANTVGITIRLYNYTFWNEVPYRTLHSTRLANES